MKLLFIHDTRVYVDAEGKAYTDGAFTMDVWSRYLALTDDFTVLLRESKIILDKETIEKYSPLDEGKIHLIRVPDLYKPKNNYINLGLRKK